jgi:hypothetical protein
MHLFPLLIVGMSMGMGAAIVVVTLLDFRALKFRNRK